MLRDDEGARSIGCTARIDDVERLDDGDMNIVVSGEAPFKVLDRFESPEYPAGEVELIAEEEVPPIDEGSANAARGLAALAERATGERPEAEELDDASAYAIASRIELPPETKQRLLEMRDEDERMGLLANALNAVERALDRAEEAAERASGNGKVHFPACRNSVGRVFDRLSRKRAQNQAKPSAEHDRAAAPRIATAGELPGTGVAGHRLRAAEEQVPALPADHRDAAALEVGEPSSSTPGSACTVPASK